MKEPEKTTDEQLEEALIYIDSLHEIIEELLTIVDNKEISERVKQVLK